MKNKLLVTLVGPTAIGKTAVAIALAKEFKTEIVSSDSRQFYQEMSIGTAVPSKEELAAVPHHFIQDRSIHQDYNVGDFEKDALVKIKELFVEQDIVLFVGGSGLYERAVTQGLDDFPTIPDEIKQKVRGVYKIKGLVPLLDELKQLDSKTFHKIDRSNVQRVSRALEVCLASNKPYSSFLMKQKKARPFKVLKIGLELPREEIYKRINQRVDIMMKEGLVEEAKSLHEYKDLNALQTVGYKELFAFFEGKYTQEEALEEIKKNTRRFAKRQLTWYRKEAELQWFNPSDIQGMSQFIESNKEE